MLRVALLTMIESSRPGVAGALPPGAEPPSGVAGAVPRSFLPVGGASVARHQLALCQALECQRVVCIARELGPDLVALQHGAEAAGMQFHVVLGARQVGGLITANDEIVVLADGLLAAPAGALPLLEAGHGMLVQPVETGVPLGFERLDINHASAGAMRIPGRLAERLAELPADCDVASALTRIALQAGVAQRPVPMEARDGVGWRIVRDEAEAQAIEAGWIDLHMQQGRAATPGTVLARLGVRSVGPALLHAGNAGNMLAIGAGIVMMMALGAGWFGATTAAMLLAGLCWIGRHAAELLTRIERDALSQPSPRIAREVLFGWLLDGVLILLVAWNAGVAAEHSWAERGFAPLLLLCLLRILPRIFMRSWSAWLEDRAFLCVVLAIAAAAGALMPVVAAAAGLLGLAGACVAGLAGRITRV